MNDIDSPKLEGWRSSGPKVEGTSAPLPPPPSSRAYGSTYIPSLQNAPQYIPGLQYALHYLHISLVGKLHFIISLVGRQGRKIKGFDGARASPEHGSAPSLSQKHPFEIKEKVRKTTCNTY